MRAFALVLIASLAAACSFEHGRLEPGDEPDAPPDRIDGGSDPDAPPGTPDASFDGPVDPIDAGPDACVPLPMELCNGVDDTCEGTVDEGYDLVTPCDGDDVDLCDDDTPLCALDGLSVACTSGDPDFETCNLADDDCDGGVDEDFPDLGMPCDGGDTDLCLEGTWVCGGGAAVCNDATSSTTETCNTFDDDCDGEADEDFVLGGACDGPDGDMCVEGVVTCDVGGGTTCSDATSTSLEVCNSSDDDCDGTADEGFDLATDEANCGTCGNTCTNAFGTNTCLASACTPTCNAGAVNCDGDNDNGCETRNTAGLCTAEVIDLGDIRGDNGTSALPVTLSVSGFGEAWYRVTLTETASGGGGDPIEARIDLDVPAGVDMELYVYCLNCGPTPIDSSEAASGVDEVVSVTRADTTGSQTYDIIIEVQHYTLPVGLAEMCGDWNLTITGNSATGAGSCG